MSKIDYTSKDYLSIRQALLALKKDKLPTYTNESASDFGVFLIEQFASIGDMMSYYIDRVANESFINLCKERPSAVRLAELIGYVPQESQPASVAVTFTLSSNPSGTTIPAGDEVQVPATDTENPINFYLSSDLIISAPSLTGVATCFHGSAESDIFIGTGLPNQQYKLPKFPVSSGSIKITISAQSWTQVQFFSDKLSTDKVFRISVQEDDSVIIQFGNGINGSIPPNGVNINISYKRGGGVGFKVLANTVTRYLGNVSNVSSVNNLSNGTDGTDKEALPSIRISAPASLKTMDRCVTVDDFETETLEVPGVQQAQAREYGGFVRIAIIPSGGGLPTETLKRSVFSSLKTKKMLGTQFAIADPIFVPISVTVTVAAMPGFKNSDVQSRVLAVINQYLDYTQKDSSGVFIQSFGKDVFLSTLYRLVDSVDGVNNSSITLLKRTSLQGTIVGDVDLSDLDVRQAGTINVTVTQGQTLVSFEDQTRTVIESSEIAPISIKNIKGRVASE